MHPVHDMYSFSSSVKLRTPNHRKSYVISLATTEVVKPLTTLATTIELSSLESGEGRSWLQSFIGMTLHTDTDVCDVYHKG